MSSQQKRSQPGGHRQTQPSALSRESVRTAPTIPERLEDLPALRAIPWRAGLELPSEDSLNSQRVQKRCATLLATRGRVADRPCASCVAGLGRFAECVVMDGWLDGSCASCLFKSKAKQCSLRVETSGPGSNTVVDSRGITLDDSGWSRKRKRRPTEKVQKSAKELAMMREREQGRAYDEQHNAYTEKRLAQALPEIDARPEDDDLIAYYKSQTRRPPNDGPTFGNGVGGGVHNTSSRGRPLPEHASGPARPSAVPAPSGGIAVPLIDTLPRSKQGQIYGIVSGVQSGIDHLQKELNSLKTLLGLDLVDAAD